jgi:hypothetical protein
MNQSQADQGAQLRAVMGRVKLRLCQLPLTGPDRTDVRWAPFF